jgi:hypothetical protein
VGVGDVGGKADVVTRDVVISGVMVNLELSQRNSVDDRFCRQKTNVDFAVSVDVA